MPFVNNAMSLELTSDYMNYPIVAFLGDRGDGKTVSMTALAYAYQKLGANIYANFTLIGIPYTKITFQDLADFPEYLKDGLVLLDEGHIGADAYAFFNSRVKNISKFATQTRKKRLTVFYSTQVLTTVAKRLRTMTNYICECNKTEIKGVTDIYIYDRSLLKNSGFVKNIIIDGRPFFGYYDTNEIIELDEE